MKVYITPYDIVNNNFLNITSSIDWYEVYYKTQKGPLGFNTDEKSSLLFNAMVENTIWFNKYNCEFEHIDNTFLKRERMLGFNGVFMLPNEYVLNEVEKEKELKATIIKNKPRRKYNKPLLEEKPSFFTDLYDSKKRQYTDNKIAMLLHEKIDIAIGNSDSLGSHFIMKEGSTFMNRLIAACNELNIEINRVDGERYVPAW